MKFLAPILVAVAILVGLAPTPVTAFPATRVMESIVKITSENSEGKTGFCTGFVVDLAGRVVTAEHCLSDTGQVSVNGEPSYVIARDGWIIIVQGPVGVRPLQLARKQPGLFEDVYSVGNAFDWGVIIVKRQVAGWYPTDGGHKDLVVNAPLAPGMSGGPILNEAGEVVAINQMATVATGVGCEVEAIKDLLD